MFLLFIFLFFCPVVSLAVEPDEILENQILEEIENLMPWERDVYSTLLVNYLREERERLEEKNRR